MKTASDLPESLHTLQESKHLRCNRVGHRVCPFLSLVSCMKSALPAFLQTTQQGILLDILEITENGLENGLDLKFKTLFAFQLTFPDFEKSISIFF